MATGPVLGLSNVGPVLGWEGSMGAGPLLLSGGGAVRPRAGNAVTSGYAGAVLWEIVASPKLGVLSACPLADARSPFAALKGLSP